MSINKQIKNTIYTLKRQNKNYSCNIAYFSSDSLFDIAIQQLDNSCMVPIDIQTAKTTLGLFYSGLWINDILEFSQKIPHYGDFFTNYILTVHGPPNPMLKREDIAILSKSLSKYEIISFCSKYHEWKLSNIKYIPYGVPKLESVSINKKERDILVINLKQQKQTAILYQYLKNNFSKTDMLTSIDHNILNIQDTLSKYSVCIDFDHYYNLVMGNSCGAYGITSLPSEDENIYTIKNSNEIFALVSQLIKSDNANKISMQTIEKYNWSTFAQNICNHIRHIQHQDFIV